MALPREYLGEDCALARALEIVGERWTLLIVRDAFYGVRRFSDFRDHLGIPRAVLTDRLNLLVGHAILERSVGASGRDEYALTPKGQRLWPAMWSLMSWGNDFYQGGRPASAVHPQRVRGPAGSRRCLRRVPHHSSAERADRASVTVEADASES